MKTSWIQKIKNMYSPDNNNIKNNRTLKTIKAIKNKSLKFKILLICSVIIAIWGGKQLLGWVKPNTPPAPPSIRVQTARVKIADMPEVIETIGFLEPKQDIKIKVASGILTQVQNILVPSGTFVKKGTRLITLVGVHDIQAPFDGYLTDWKVRAGENVSGGHELVDLVNTDTLALSYKIPENFAGKLDLKQSVELKVKAFPNQVFQGEVDYVAPMVDKKTYTILVKALVKNQDQNLWPGMAVQVRHILAKKPDAVVVPESALQLSMEGYEVFKVKDGKLARTPVQVGTRRNGRVQVLNGVTKDDFVVVVQTDAIVDGAPVIAEEWKGEW